jgi:hypothetical protein
VAWLLPAVEGVLLFVLLTGDPARLAPRAPWLRPLVVTLVCLLVAAALWGTVLLIYDLIKGVGVTNSPQELLASGGLVWLGNNLAFAMLYWLIDSGGPLARSRQELPIDFAFTQQLSPEVAPAGWRPVFLDYLHLGFTNATAFSPTDVMPLTLKAKYTMIVQSTVALALFGLIVARAVNALTYPTVAAASVPAPMRSSRWSPTRSEFAIAVRAGFTAPMLGKTLVSTT